MGVQPRRRAIACPSETIQEGVSLSPICKILPWRTKSSNARSTSSMELR